MQALNGTFGGHLRQWRRSRRLSQLQLASLAGVSSRHLSFAETGRSAPSRDMVLLLAGLRGRRGAGGAQRPFPPKSFENLQVFSKGASTGDVINTVSVTDRLNQAVLSRSLVCPEPALAGLTPDRSLRQYHPGARRPHRRRRALPDHLRRRP